MDPGQDCFRGMTLPRRRKRRLGMHEELAAGEGSVESCRGLLLCASGLRSARQRDETRRDETRLWRRGPWLPCQNLAAAAHDC